MINFKRFLYLSGIILILCYVTINLTWCKSREIDKCYDNLIKLNKIKQEYLYKQQGTLNDALSLKEVLAQKRINITYFKCPENGIYHLNSINQIPTCSKHPNFTKPD